MKFGVREICDVVFKAKSTMTIGNQTFKKGQPVLYIDTAKTSTMEGSGTTVYAQGGRGNTRLMAWEGERALTFTVGDALLSPIGFAILSGAGLFKGTGDDQVHVHATARATVVNGTIELDQLKNTEEIDATAPVFAAVVESDGSITGDILTNLTVGTDKRSLTGAATNYNGKNVFVDFYLLKKSANVSEIQIDASTFGGYFYVEASTLFKDKETGKDLPAELTFPNVKIQSNFSFNMSSTGDPSTFSFVMDAFPGYTMFNKGKEVMCAIQILEDEILADTSSHESVMKHPTGFVIEENTGDSVSTGGEV
jgi:hypothetical protein